MNVTRMVGLQGLAWEELPHKTNKGCAMLLLCDGCLKRNSDDVGGGWG